MEHLKSYYTLEKHLEESASINKQFEILNAIWKLNKRNLSSALSNVSQYFPHYSLHERSHSSTILSNIESFLGEDRIKRLSPTNTWLILMSAYTHDLGMVVFQDLIHKEWLSDNFQDFLTELSECDNIELKEDASLLLTIQALKEKIQTEKEYEELTPIKIKNAVTTIVAEYIRRIHHERSSDIIKGADKQFYEIANSFYSDQIPKRLLNILGEVAFLHGVEFYEIFKRLEYESNGISSDKINPRLIACLLRLGDLLDVDDSRFNNFTQKVFEYPNSSRLHVEKHASIKHILITPEAIEITSDCPSEEVYRLARNWFDWLEDEVEKQSKEWSIIAPSDLGGSSPTIPKGKIKVYFKNQEVDDKLLNLRFEVSNKKIFEILEGASIYDKAELTFIREIVQNALDASKIQLWKDIENGTFDFVFQTDFEDSSLTHDQIISRIQFPTDIPETLYKSFNVTLNVNWKDDNKDVLVFEITDSGTGISDSDLVRITNKVGESRKKDKEFQKFLKRMPFWLKPTGAFGIGMQSVFIITDHFKVITKANGEQPKEIIFRSSKKGKYSSVGKTNTTLNRGTRVIIEIVKNRFQEIFGSTFSWDIISNYDYFTDKHDSIYIPKIRMYIDEVLSKISNLRINFFEELLEYKNVIHNDELFQIDSSTDQLLGMQSRLLVYNNDIFFEFHEKSIGSEFTYYFFPEFKYDIDDNWTIRQTEYFVRDIPVKSSTINYYKLSFSKLYWNFMSPESDKILSLTREKFIAKKKIELQNTFLNDIVPHSLKFVENLFLDNWKKLIENHGVNEDHLSTIYFKILLTKSVNGLGKDISDSEIFKEKLLPIDLAENLDGSQVSMVSFFTYPNVIVPAIDSQSRKELLLIQENREEIIANFTYINREQTILIKHKGFFYYYLLVNYHIKEIHYSDKSRNFLLTSQEGEKITINGDYNKYLASFLEPNSLLERGLSYSDQKYYDKLATRDIHASGFEHFPYLSKTAIISPFKKYNDYITLKNECASGDMEKNLNVNKIKEIIPKKLVDWIIKYKPKDVPERTEEDVYKGYRLLIQDMLGHDLESTIKPKK